MKKLMIIDDEFIVRVGIRSIVDWEKRGYTVVAEAASGTEALEKITECPPDIVLTDLVMDNMDGFELIRRCSEEYPEISFVVLSGYNDFENVRRAMKLGAKDYIFKLKANPEEILRVLDEISSQTVVKTDVHRSLLDGVVRENLQVIKHNLLHKWVNHQEHNAGRIVSQFKALSLRVDPLKPYELLYISIDDFAQKRISGDLKDVPLIKSSMENIIYEISPRAGGFEVFDYEGGDMVIFINCDDGNGKKHDETIEEDIGESFNKIRDYLKRYLGIEVSGVISPVITGTEKLPECIGVCGNTLRQRTGGGRLWSYNGGQRNEIAMVKEYVAKHFGEKFGIREAAAHAAMSESYFSHVFKKEAGISFVDYVNRARMERAAELLENRSLKMSDIAGQIGIDNPNYFSVLFKKIMGLSPQEYRNKNAGS
jgi:two-component system response regulator YesN